MDELSLFDKAPRQLIQRETALMKCADLVLTGGPSLYEAKKDRHPNVHCFSSSVDVAHFANALDRAIETPVQTGLPGYRLGYFGVIDERLDLGLIENLAQRHPEWQLIMVGPVVKISPQQLPQRDNIHYYGQQFYDELPRFLAGWDVCLMPFAHNKATRFISPTKTLEYMAAEKPIVSTSITDVAALYSDIVYLGDSPDEFIAACEAALGASEAETAGRTARMRQVLAKTSWNSTASAISELINEVVQCKLDKASISAAPPLGSPLSNKALPVNSKTGSQGLKKPAHVIIGAGPTGLSAAYHMALLPKFSVLIL
jgi:UDP-galactopyranose mutase